MSNNENDQISLYCHPSKTIEGPGTSFQSLALSQNHVRNVCRTAHQYLTKLGCKINKHHCNFHYIAMPMMASQILKSVDFTKTRKSRYLEVETFFTQIKKLTNYTSRAYFIVKNSFVAEVTLKQLKVATAQRSVLAQMFKDVIFSQERERDCKLPI